VFSLSQDHGEGHKIDRVLANLVIKLTDIICRGCVSHCLLAVLRMCLSQAEQRMKRELENALRHPNEPLPTYSSAKQPPLKALPTCNHQSCPETWKGLSQLKRLAFLELYALHNSIISILSHTPEIQQVSFFLRDVKKTRGCRISLWPLRDKINGSPGVQSERRRPDSRRNNAGKTLCSLQPLRYACKLPRKEEIFRVV
jgi:hypothetical protein